MTEALAGEGVAATARDILIALAPELERIRRALYQGEPIADFVRDACVGLVRTRGGDD